MENLTSYYNYQLQDLQTKKLVKGKFQRKG